MTDEKTNHQDQLAFAIHLIAHLPKALLHQIADLNDLTQALEALDGHTCTGRAHWRDKDTPGKTRKLYILHRTDQACPIHGQPPRGGRTRSYVGNKPDKIAEALAAIEREILRLEVLRKVQRLQAMLGHVVYQTKSLYRYLDHIPPAPGQNGPATPAEDLRMATK